MTDIGHLFQENGYYHARGVFDAEAVQDLAQAFDGVVEQLQASGEDIDARWDSAACRLGAADTQVWHTHQVQCFDARWLQAFQNPRLLAVAESILGPDIVLHHSKLFCKPAGVGAPFPMHQDWEYFPMREDRSPVLFTSAKRLTKWVVCGCTQVVTDWVASSVCQRGQIKDRYAKTYSKNIRLIKATIIEAESGDIIFFHYCTLHGSMPNRSEQARKTVLMQLHAGADQPETDDHPYAGLVLQGRNTCATRTGVNAL